ncbi:MAG: TPM domain-containing protein, partial [Candidatus Eremiobacteraeota bacterium]|nr:TPM domain-containing protein [Candidatus Eremiobacteraeota bacterium]
MKVARSLLTAVSLFVSAAAPVCAADFTVPPVPHHYVTDGAGALDDSTRSSVEDELRAYERQTGHQVIVWIGQTTGNVPLETFTAESAHQWHIGRKGHDDGAILFLFMHDRRVRIEVGYGLESALTDADAERIIADRIVPAMRAHDADAAVANGVAAMLKTITPDFATSVTAQTPASSGDESDAGSPPPAPPWMKVVFLIVFFGIPIVFFALFFS